MDSSIAIFKNVEGGHKGKSMESQQPVNDKTNATI